MGESGREIQPQEITAGTIIFYLTVATAVWFFYWLNGIQCPCYGWFRLERQIGEVSGNDKRLPGSVEGLNIRRSCSLIVQLEGMAKSERHI